MKIRDLRIGKYGWRVRFYFAVHGYHTRSILSSLEEIECPGTVLERVRGNLLRADMDSGFTYSNKTMRRSVVVVGLATSQAQFLNSFEHELRHLCDDIAADSGMPMQGEEVAYLTGDLNAELWPEIHQFICFDILPRLKRVGFLCASAGRRIRYGLTPAPQFGDAPPKYILSRIEVAVVFLRVCRMYFG